MTYKPEGMNPPTSPKINLYHYIIKNLKKKKKDFKPRNWAQKPNKSLVVTGVLYSARLQREWKKI